MSVNDDKIVIQQINHQLYDLYTHNGIWVCRIFMGNDNQYFKDAKALEMLKKLLIARWGL